VIRLAVGRVLVAGTVLVSIAGAQTPETPVVWRGRLVGIFDERSGEPIAGAEVMNLLNGLSAVTTETGTLSLFFVDTAGTMIRVRKLGYESLTRVVTNATTDGPLTPTLKPVTTLPTVTTTAKENADAVVHYASPLLRGFEERRHSGIGHFIAEEEMRKTPGRPLSTVIMSRLQGLMPVDISGRGRSSPGTYFAAQRGSTSGGNLRSGVGKPCLVTTYVDGVLLWSMNSGGTPPDLSRMLTDDYAGAEYYSTSEIPAQFNITDTGCGTLLIWTRER
jgi:hypothetical protein